LRPDLTTFSILPWLTGGDVTARLMCDVYTPDGQPFAGDPRSVLRRVLARAADMGLTFRTGLELEFFLLKPGPDGGFIPPVTYDSAGYFDAPSDSAAGLRRKMAAALSAVGIQVDAMHSEIGTGQHEIDFHYSDALTTADNAVTFRVVTRAIAQQNGLYCTFLPKPLRGVPGSGMHVHQSLSYSATGKNAFADSGDPRGLSKLAHHFIGGQLAHARGMCAILAPLVNSYKRLVSGYEAPVNMSWARINRSALIRVPRASSSDSTRLELRCPDPSCNPYLAFAVMLAAGLDGIQHETPAPEAAEENLHDRQPRLENRLNTLPDSLSSALDALEADPIICDTLGAYIADGFVQAKRAEWEDYRLDVTEWELKKYLPTY
jgi:glutamine synthetase